MKNSFTLTVFNIIVLTLSLFEITQASTNVCCENAQFANDPRLDKGPGRGCGSGYNVGEAKDKAKIDFFQKCLKTADPRTGGLRTQANCYEWTNRYRHDCWLVNEIPR